MHFPSGLVSVVGSLDTVLRWSFIISADGQYLKNISLRFLGHKKHKKHKTHVHAVIVLFTESYGLFSSTF